MISLLALLSGAATSVMVSVNGCLSACLGVYLSAVVIRFVGAAASFALCRAAREPVTRRIPALAHVSGLLGILTTLMNNFAFGRISMTSIVALGLLGQNIASAVIDSLGLLGMERRSVRLPALLSTAVSCVGVAVMLDPSIAGGPAAVLLSLGAGVCIVLSRVVNARLAHHAGMLAGSFYNHLMGLPYCLAAWLLLTDAPGPSIISPKPWMLLGGLLGVLILLLCNAIVPRISAARLTLLSFTGQVFTGFLIDLLRRETISGRLLVGGLVCALGLLLSLCIEHAAAPGAPSSKPTQGGRHEHHR